MIEETIIHILKECSYARLYWDPSPFFVVSVEVSSFPNWMPQVRNVYPRRICFSSSYHVGVYGATETRLFMKPLILTHWTLFSSFTGI